MTLQTQILHGLSIQHAWIRRAVHFVATSAALKADWRVFKREWAPLISMAIETTRLVGGERLGHHRTDTPVRVVTIDAGHGSFRELVMNRQLELRPDIKVTARAQLIDRSRLACNQTIGCWAVDFVARRAGDTVLSVAALQAANLRRLIQVADKTQLVGSRCGQFPQRVANVFRGGGLRMLLSRLR